MRDGTKQLERSLALAVVALAALALITYLAEGLAEMNDLEVFHRAGMRFRHGERLYRGDDGHFEFKYLPASAAMFAPLSLLPLESAKVLWLAVSWASLALALVQSARLLRDRLPWWGPPIALLVLGRSIEREYANGQVNALLLALVVCAFSLLARHGEVGAGALLGVVTILKPHWFVLLPYLLVARRWRASAAFGGTVAVGLLLPLARYGMTETLQLYESMHARLATSTSRLLVYPTNVSLVGALAKATGAGLSSVAPIAIAVLSVPSLLLARRVWKGAIRVDRDLAVLAPLVVLLSPQAWDYTVLTTLPSLLVTMIALRRASAKVRVVTGALWCVAACDYGVLLGRGAAYAAVMRWSPNTWFLLWLLAVGTVYVVTSSPVRSLSVSSRW